MLNAHRIINLKTEKDENCPSSVRRKWACELFVNDEELVKTNMYKVCFQRMPGKDKWNEEYGYSKYDEIMKLIDNKHIVGIDSAFFRDSCFAYEFHVKVTIVYCGTTEDVKMPKKLTVTPCWVSEATKLIDSIDLTDFTYIVRGKMFNVHKSILSLASPVFRSTFDCGLDESKDNTATIDDCDPDMFEHLLKFVNKGIVPDNIHEIALELYKLGHLYQIESLQRICYAHLMDTKLVRDNVVELYEAAIVYDLIRLKSDCWNFIKL